MRFSCTSPGRALAVDRFAVVLVVASSLGPVAARASQPSPRERISINDDWRFQKGDPPGNTVSLIYDVRPEVQDVGTTARADAEAACGRAGRRPRRRPSSSRGFCPPGTASSRTPRAGSSRPAGTGAATSPTCGGTSTTAPGAAWTCRTTGPSKGRSSPAGRSAAWAGCRAPGVGWYRKKLDIPAADAGKSIFLDMDGAMSYATVWLNGQLVGGWPYGYASWRVDLTPYVVPGGENQLAIRLDNPPDSSRWYPGGGIYRNVWLTKTQPVHVGQWGTYADDARGLDGVRHGRPGGHGGQRLREPARPSASPPRSTPWMPRGGRAGDAVAAIAPAERARRAADERRRSRARSTLAQPTALGTAAAADAQPLRRGDDRVAATARLIDSYETPFGIRDVRFDPDQGVFVNGERIQIKGVNNHHDLGALGAAFNTRAAERQLEMLREMGCNAIRMSHNPPAPELLELTDRMGFLVMDEAFDVWERQEDAARLPPDLPGLARTGPARARPPRPQPPFGDPVEHRQRGRRAVHGRGRARPWRSGCATSCARRIPRGPRPTAMNFAKPDMPLPAVVDVISLNYQGEGIRDTPEFEGTDAHPHPPQYPAFHAEVPGQADPQQRDRVGVQQPRRLSVSRVEGAERARAGRPRRRLEDPPGERLRAARRRLRLLRGQGVRLRSRGIRSWPASSCGPAGTTSASRRPTTSRAAPTRASSTWPGSRRTASTSIRRTGGPNCRWRTSCRTGPGRSASGRSRRCTSSPPATKAELFLNGKSLGRKKKGPYEYRLRWDDVVYEPGTLEVVAYKNGRRWATDTVRTARSRRAARGCSPTAPRSAPTATTCPSSRCASSTRTASLRPARGQPDPVHDRGPGRDRGHGQRRPDELRAVPGARAQRLQRAVPRDRPSQGGTAGPHPAHGFQRGPERGHRSHHRRGARAVSAVKRPTGQSWRPSRVTTGIGASSKTSRSRRQVRSRSATSARQTAARTTSRASQAQGRPSAHAAISGSAAQ